MMHSKNEYKLHQYALMYIKKFQYETMKKRNVQM